ncbi:MULTISPECIES: DsbA family protein [Vibrio]|uniref:DsbA family protein n=1 Tax=Vibrio TaxID=662 RepID=UPI000C165790|nr:MULTISPECIES: DsbA family protein [Vibrio]NNN44776.1 DsbA family protein [Vibrio sp. 1-1(7)]NNN72149.1 DsbA family protein [Vibrio sp. 12-2(3-a)]
MVKVHYFFDPMCGWCFGASPLLETLAEMPTITLKLHPGGMLPRSELAAEFRAHILEADQQISLVTGQVFGEAYRSRIASQQPLIVDSYLTAQAIIAAEALQGLGLAMLKKIQQAHYQRGLTVAEPEVLAQLASQLGIEHDKWHNAMQQAKSDLPATIANSQQLMAQYQLRGFPSLMIEQANGQWHSVQPSVYYGKLNQWQAFWQSMAGISSGSHA